jgi:hypothetical protein
VARSAPPAARPAARPARAPHPLAVLLARRHRACRHLGIAVPREIAGGPPETLAWRVATLDRWIGRTLDHAGGVRMPPPGRPDDPLDDPFEDDPEDDDRPELAA